MEELIVELRLFLELLDHEYLTSTVREKKAVITDILLRIQSSRGMSLSDFWSVFFQSLLASSAKSLQS